MPAHPGITNVEIDSAAATVVLAVATANKKNRLHSLDVTSTGATTIELLAGATALTGQVPIAAGVRYTISPEQAGGFATAENEALSLVIGGAGALDGSAGVVVN